MFTKNYTCLTSKKDQKQKVPVQVQPSDLLHLHHTRRVHLDHEDIPFHSSMHLQNNFAVRPAVPVQNIGQLTLHHQPHLVLPFEQGHQLQQNINVSSKSKQITRNCVEKDVDKQESEENEVLRTESNISTKNRFEALGNLSETDQVLELSPGDLSIHILKVDEEKGYGDLDYQAKTVFGAT